QPEFNNTLTQLIEDVGFDGRFRRTLTFAPNVTTLSEEHKAAIGDVMCHVGDLAGKDYWVQLRAYTGKKSSQRRLTESRLVNVRRALVQAGVPLDHIRIKKEGSAKAVILSHDAMAVNTKIITITVQPNPQEMPGGSKP
ncbi:MAG: hypothetical protein EBV03_13430, partial [Proteobacteria bacterium]|nr:hypothetical protein [Pseudomonadota bacterium]